MTVILWPNCLNILLFGRAEGWLVRAEVKDKIGKTSKTAVLPRFSKKESGGTAVVAQRSCLPKIYGYGPVGISAPRGPCLDNSACKLNDPTILGDRSVFRHGLADLNSIIKGTWAQLLPYASQPADHLAPSSG